MKLSVIVPAYNRHEMTVRHVAECLKSTRLPDEIVVVNDGGPENLRDMLLPLKGKVPIRYVRIDQDILWGYNMACNVGFWVSRGDIIALEDTDHVPSRNAYSEGLALFEANPGLMRLKYRRNILQIGDFGKPFEEWQSRKLIGANQMVSLFRRELYINLKGQDERFCGQYGYMAMDFHNREANMLKSTISLAHKGFYWAIFGDEGEPGLKRGMSPVNRRFYRENSLAKTWQHPEGIIRCTYSYEEL